MKFTLSTPTMIVAVGAASSQKPSSRSRRASFRSRPQLGSGGWAPRPRTLSEASANNRPGKGHAHLDHDWGGDVGEDVSEHDAKLPGTESPGRRHEHSLEQVLLGQGLID
jgi:hypothetical protein